MLSLVMLVKSLMSWLPKRHQQILCRWIYLRSDSPQQVINYNSIVYQSPNYLVVNKAYDLVINSNDDDQRDTVAKQLAVLRPELVDPKTYHGFRFVHRLDFATSGLLCIALNKKAAGWASKAFNALQVTKHYVALINGYLPLEAVSNCPSGVMTVDCPIGKDIKAREKDIMKMTSDPGPNCAEPKRAVTDIVLLEHGLYKGQPASKVLLIPHTGRSHQLRVHCLHIGHRIIGDYMYSNKTDTDNFRMMLHAYRFSMRLELEHLDVKTEDPFLNSVDFLWQPMMVFRTYESYLSELHGEY